MAWALHAEQEGGPPFHASGWGCASVSTVPGAHLAQPGVISRNAFPYAGCLTIWLRSEGVGDDDVLVEDAVRSAVASFLAKTKGGAAFVGMSTKVLQLLGAASSDRCPAFTAKPSTDTGEVLLPASGGDLLFWLKGHDAEWCSKVCQAVQDDLGSCAMRAEETQCAAWEGRDLTGFIDGTANPDSTLRSLAEVALQPDGGSICFASRFVHNLAAFKAMCPAAQSAIIARDLYQTKPAKGSDGRLENPRYLTPDLRGHILRAWGDMYRQALPYHKGAVQIPGAGNDEGLMFIAMAKDAEEFETVLKRMCGEFAHLTTVGKDFGHDNIFQISRAASAMYFYVPPMAELVHLCKCAEACPGLDALPAFPINGIDERLRGKLENRFCLNCEEDSNFMLPNESDLAQCLLCRKLFHRTDAGFPAPNL